MFSITTNMGSKTLREIHSTEVADHAIYFFLSALDKTRQNESIHLHRDGERMASKTPKRKFIAPEWR